MHACVLVVRRNHRGVFGFRSASVWSECLERCHLSRFLIIFTICVGRSQHAIPITFRFAAKAQHINILHTQLHRTDNSSIHYVKESCVAVSHFYAFWDSRRETAKCAKCSTHTHSPALGPKASGDQFIADQFVAHQVGIWRRHRITITTWRSLSRLEAKLRIKLFYIFKRPMGWVNAKPNIPIIWTRKEALYTSRY